MTVFPGKRCGLQLMPESWLELTERTRLLPSCQGSPEGKTDASTHMFFVLTVTLDVQVGGYCHVSAAVTGHLVSGVIPRGYHMIAFTECCLVFN